MNAPHPRGTSVSEPGLAPRAGPPRSVPSAAGSAPWSRSLARWGLHPREWSAVMGSRRREDRERSASTCPRDASARGPADAGDVGARRGRPGVSLFPLVLRPSFPPRLLPAAGFGLGAFPHPVTLGRLSTLTCGHPEAGGPPRWPVRVRGGALRCPHSAGCLGEGRVTSGVKPVPWAPASWDPEPPARGPSGPSPAQFPGDQLPTWHCPSRPLLPWVIQCFPPLPGVLEERR